jgi:hypothetical protein
LIPASAADWPCVSPNSSGTANCLVCSAEHPCLFDLLADESERTNLASQHPSTVAQLAAELAGYVPYVDGTMTAAELQGYECVNWKGEYPHPWWGNFTGPCCRPKPMGGI